MQIYSLKLMLSYFVHFDVAVSNVSTLCLKKVPTIKLSVTLSSVNRFPNFLHCWKAYEICYKTDMTLTTSP